SAATDGQLGAEIWSWTRARGLCAGVERDGAVLQIDNDANRQVYGASSTPRAIFENRAAQAPCDTVVSFRDQLEEATAAARATLGTDARSAAPVAAANPDPTGASTAPLATSPTADPQPQPFEPVNDNPALVEPLPETP